MVKHYYGVVIPDKQGKQQNMKKDSSVFSHISIYNLNCLTFLQKAYCQIDLSGVFIIKQTNNLYNYKKHGSCSLYANRQIYLSLCNGKHPSIWVVIIGGSE